MMTSVLNKKELEWIKFLKSKEIGVLKEVDAKDVKMHKEQGGEVLNACGDANRFADIYGHRVLLTNKIRPENHKVQPVILNGGPLLLSRKSPLYDPVMARHIRQAMVFNNLHNIAIYGHAPCGAANLEDITLKQNFELIIDGEIALQKSFKKAAQNLKKCLDENLGKNLKNLKKSLERNNEKWLLTWIKKNTSDETLSETIGLMISLFNAAKTTMYFHIDNGHKRTYFLSLTAWKKHKVAIDQKWEELMAA